MNLELPRFLKIPAFAWVFVWCALSSLDARATIWVDIDATTFCAGETIPVRYANNFAHNSFHDFYAILSDANGDFTNPDTIGSVNATGTLWDTIFATVPAQIAYGTGYRVKVVSLVPAQSSSQSNPALTLGLPQADFGTVSSLCNNPSLTLSVASGSVNYTWSTGATASSINVTQTGIYAVTVSNSTCTALYSTAVSNTTPASFSLPDTVATCNDSVLLDAGPGFPVYAWDNGATTPTTHYSHSKQVTCTITDTNGCSVSDSTFALAGWVKIDVQDTLNCAADAVEITTTNGWCSEVTDFGDDLIGFLNPLGQTGQPGSGSGGLSNYSGGSTRRIAITKTHIYCSGSYRTGRWEIDNPGNSTTLNQQLGDGMVSDLSTGKLYTLWRNFGAGYRVPIGSANQTIDGLCELNGSLFIVDTTLLAQPLSGINVNGVFSGAGYVIIWSSLDSAFHKLEYATGQVTTLGYGDVGSRMNILSTTGFNIGFSTCAGNHHAIYFTNTAKNRIERYEIESGVLTTVTQFNDMGNFMPSIALSPWHNRWYWAGSENSQWPTVPPGNAANTAPIGWNDVSILGNIGSAFTNAQVTWSSGDTSASIIHPPSTTQTYTVTATLGSHSCYDTVNMDTLPNPVFQLPDTLFSACDDPVVGLDAGTGHTIYSWTTGDSTQVSQTSSSGFYHCTVGNAVDCFTSDSTYVQVFTPSIDQADTSVCAGNEVLLPVSGASETSIVKSFNTFAPYTTDLSGANSTVRGAYVLLNNYLPIISNDSFTYAVNGNLIYPLPDSVHSDGWTSDLVTGKLYSFWNTVNNSFLVSSSDHTAIDAIRPNASLFSSNGWHFETPVSLSQTINAGLGSGVFSGRGFVILWANHNNTFYKIDYQTGQVDVLGTFDMANEFNIGDVWATWGVAETFGASYSVVYRKKNTDEIWRLTLPELNFSLVKQFSDLGDISGFSVQPGGNRFYWYGAGANEFTSDTTGHTGRVYGLKWESYGVAGAQVSWNTGSGSTYYRPQPTSTMDFIATMQIGSNVCLDTVSVTVFNPPTPLSLSDSTASSCSTNVITLDAGPGYSNYSWSTGATTQSIAVDSTDTVTVVAGFGAGCTVTDTAVITINEVIQATYSSTPALSCNHPTGTASINVTSGTAPFTYNWSTGTTGTDLAGAHSGTYTVTITDSTGCTEIREVIVGELPSINMNTTVTPISCPGANDGAIAMATNGGNPVTYTWSNGGSGSPITNLSPGTYTMTLTKANGCFGLDTVTLVDPPGVTVSLSSTNTLCPGSTSGTATATAGGGNGGPYTYNWSSGASTSTATGLTNGTHTVTVSDGNGCTATASVSVGYSSNLSLSMQGTNATCNGSSTGIVSANAGSGTAPYTYTWSTGATGQVLSSVPAGNYGVTVTDANGCQRTGSRTIYSSGIYWDWNTPGLTQVSCPGEIDGTMAADVLGGTSPITYTWNGPSGSFSSTNFAGHSGGAGTYNVVVSDANGCSLTHTFVLVDPPPPTATITSSTNVSAYGATDGGAIGTGYAPPKYGQINTTEYEWSNGASGMTLSGVGAGTYIFEVTNTICSAYDTVVITQPPGFDINPTSTASSCGVWSVSTNPSGGTAPYTWAWSNGASTSSATGLSPGQISVTVTDAGGLIMSETIDLPATSGMVISPVKLDESSIGNDGAAGVALSGGNAPYTFNWNTGASASFINGLSAGTYTVTVTDGSGCSQVEVINVLLNAGLVGSATIAQSQCNNTLNSLGDYIYHTGVSGATDYRALITTTGFSTVKVRGSTVPNFRLDQVPGIAYGTTYNMSVAGFVNGAWQNYGVSCPITTPPLPSTELLPAYCNSTVSTFNDEMWISPVPGATNYRYEITASGGFNYTYVRGYQWTNFKLIWIPGIAFNTTYTIRVASYINGSWTPYGPACTVSTPNTQPTTELLPAYCGSTLTALNDEMWITPIQGATNYRYEVTATGFNQVYTRGYQWTNFRMHWVPGTVNNTTYTVRVAAEVGGSWGPYGPACTVTTPSSGATTKLLPAYCNSTLSSASDYVYIDNVPGATNYRYRVSGNGLNHVYTRGYQWTNFRMAWIPGAQYGNTYNVEVAAYVGGWGPYGDTCTLTMPATIPLTKLHPNFCNISAPAWNHTFYVDLVPLASKWRYRFSLPGGFNQVTERTSATGTFVLSSIPNLTMSTTYDVEVAAYVNGVWGSYGDTCTLTTPNVPLRVGFFDQPELAAAELDATEVLLYPNPTAGQVWMDFTGFEEKTVDLTVLDLQGRIVREVRIPIGSAHQTELLHLGGEASGVYLFRFVTGDAVRFRKVTLH